MMNDNDEWAGEEYYCDKGEYPKTRLIRVE